jgi:hypothetical protein
MYKLFLAGLFLFFFYTVSAQSWEVGASSGGSGYLGDLNQSKPYKLSNIAFGGLIKRNLDPYWSFKFSLLYGKIAANDANSDNTQFQQRNLSFFSQLAELSLQTEFNLFKYVPSISDKVYTPYLFAGVSYVAFNPKARYNGEVYELNPYRTEGQAANERYKTEAVAIPFGAGIKYNIAGKWNIIGELGYRTAFTDFLDDVSGVYPNVALFTNGTAAALSDRSGENTGVYIGATGTQRGDFRKRDTYMFAIISLTYTFITPKCYVFK